jgi:hypothetical protein
LNELSPLPNNTPFGPNVTVSMPNGVSITYCSVTTAGRTFSSIVKNPFDAGLQVDPLLSGFNLEGPQVPSGIARSASSVVLLWSSALWGQGCASSPAKVKLPIPPGITLPRILELRWDGNRKVWNDITRNVNTQTGTIEGDISSSFLGVLSVAQAAAPNLKAWIESHGTDPVNGYFVDLKIFNLGNGKAEQVSINQLTFNTLLGRGTASYNTLLSPPLPRSVGSIALGANIVVRMYLSSTTQLGSRGGSRALEIVEGITYKDELGGTYSTELSQSFLP